MKPTHRCDWSPGQNQRYMNKISGPLLDRIDLQCEIMPLSFEEMSNATPGESSAQIRKKCEWTKDTVDLIAGYTVKGPNGKTIFLPCAGFKSAETEAPDSCSGQGYYWSGSHTRGRAEKAKAFCLTIGVADSATVVELERYNGLCIRPVSNK